MKNFFRQSMAWLHTWVGLLAGWILYFMFITGTAGYLNYEIDRWMAPELPLPQVSTDAPAAVDKADAWLRQHAPADSTRWIIRVPVDRQTPYLTALWLGGEGGRGEARLDLTTGEPFNARETGGGRSLYVMHYDLHYMPQIWGQWIVGVCTMFMLVALITGVVVHKKIFKDFFTFRPGKGQRSWLDAHNVVSVVSLPYQLMITYSGLVFFLLTYMPFVVNSVYGPGAEGRQAFIQESFSQLPVPPPAGTAATLLPLRDRVVQSQVFWAANAGVRVIDIRNPGDAHAQVILRQTTPPGALRNGGETLVYDGASGDLLAHQPKIESPASAFRSVLLALHEGHFAGPILRVLYVLSGLLGAAMIGTGLVLWTAKRRSRKDAAHASIALVGKLNIATLVGLPVGIAAYFWANRLLPVEMPGRAEWEMHALFLTWLALFVHAAVRPYSVAWKEQLWIAAAAFAALPLLNALTTSRHLFNSLPAGDWVFAGFDLTMLALAAGCAWATTRLRSAPVARPSRRASKARHAIEAQAPMGSEQ